MELRQGYKQTEVGVIPQNWKVRRLGECLTAHPDYGIGAPAVPYSDRLPVYLRITDISDDGRFSPTGRVSVRDTRAHAYYLRDGDIVFARTGASVGKSYLYKSEDGDLVFAGFLVRVHPDSVSLVPAYLAAYVATDSYWRWVRQMSMRSGQPGINGNEYAELPIPVPPVSEQRTIATALADVDTRLLKLDELIAKKRDLKQAAMQEILSGRRRLPGFSREWGASRLEEICAMKSGEGITSADIDEHSRFPCYGGNGLRGFTARYTHDGKYALVGRQGALCGNVLGVEGKFFASEHAIVVTPFPQTDIRWLTRVLGEMRLNQYSESSAQPGLSVSKVLALSCRVPPTEEQTAISTVLSDMDDEIAALESRRDKTRALKQGMMQQLLTGRIRLV